jgi:hypothetical protein
MVNSAKRIVSAMDGASLDARCDALIEAEEPIVLFTTA